MVAASGISTGGSLCGIPIILTNLSQYDEIYFDGTQWVNQAGGATEVTSVSNSDGTLTISPTSGAVVASIALAHANTWTGQQTFASATTTPISITLSATPTGSASVYNAGWTEPSNAVAFATTPQTGDYHSSFIGTATLTNPSAGTITNASALKILAAPVASTNVVITNAYALWVAGGMSRFDGIVQEFDTSLVVNASDTTKQLGYSFAGMTTGVKLTLSSSQSTSQTLTIPNISGADTLATLGLAQTWTAVQTYTNSDIALLGSSTGKTTFTSNNSSGTNYTLTIPANSGTLAELNFAQTWSAAQTFTQSDLLLLGSSTGATTLNSGLSGAGNNTLTLPITASDTLAGLGTAQTWTAVQTFTNSDIALLGSSTGKTTITSANASSTNYTHTIFAATGTVPLRVASTSQKSESGADNNVLTFTPPAVAGNYRVSFILDVSAASSATLGWTVTYKDSNGNSVANTNMSMFKAGSAAPVLTSAISAPNNFYASAEIGVDNSATNIVVQLTFTGTSFTAKCSASILQLA